MSILRFIVGLFVCEHELIRRRDELGQMGVGCFRCGRWWAYKHVQERLESEAVEVAELESIYRA